jgi:hypothetical protein
MVVEVEGQTSPEFVLRASVPELKKYEFCIGDGITPSAHVFLGSNFPTNGVVPIVTVGSIRVLGAFIKSDVSIIAMCDDHSPVLHGRCTIQFVASGLEYGLRTTNKAATGNGVVLVTPTATNSFKKWQRKTQKKDRRDPDATKMDSQGVVMFQHLIVDVLYEFYVLRSMMRFLQHTPHRNVIQIEKGCRAAYRVAEQRLRNFGIDQIHSELETQAQRAAERQSHIIKSLASPRCALAKFGVVEFSTMRQRAELAAIAAGQSALDCGMWSKAGFDSVIHIDTAAKDGAAPPAMELDNLCAAKGLSNADSDAALAGNPSNVPPKTPCKGKEPAAGKKRKETERAAPGRGDDVGGDSCFVNRGRGAGGEGNPVGGRRESAAAASETTSSKRERRSQSASAVGERGASASSDRSMASSHSVGESAAASRNANSNAAPKSNRFTAALKTMRKTK